MLCKNWCKNYGALWIVDDGIKQSIYYASKWEIKIVCVLYF